MQHELGIGEELRRAAVKIDAAAAGDRAWAAVQAIEERVLDDANLTHFGAEDLLQPRAQGGR